MSYEIIYNIFTLKRNNKFYPYFLIGSNNCFDTYPSYRRERDLHQLPAFFNKLNEFNILDEIKSNIDLKSFDEYINNGIIQGKYFPEIRYLGYKQHYGKGFDNLWAKGYYCGSAGHVSQEQVKRYIQEQEGKDVFEYDIYNCPEKLKGQLKIGDFSA